MDIPNPIRIQHWVLMHINMTAQGQKLQYSWSYSTPFDIGGITQANLICQALYVVIIAPWKTCHSVTCQLDNITCETNYPIGPNFAGIYVPPTAQYGNQILDAMPLNVALAYKLGGGIRGRFAHGRTMLGAMDEGQLSGSIFNGAYLSSTALFMAQHLTTLQYGNDVAIASIASRKYHVLTTLLTVAADVFVDSQRRRLPGRGR